MGRSVSKGLCFIGWSSRVPSAIRRVSEDDSNTREGLGMGSESSLIQYPSRGSAYRSLLVPRPTPGGGRGKMRRVCSMGLVSRVRGRTLTSVG